METPRAKPFNLEIANEMYKAAFAVKKQKFANENPGLSETELHQKTLKYFIDIPKDD